MNTTPSNATKIEKDGLTKKEVRMAFLNAFTDNDASSHEIKDKFNKGMQNLEKEKEAFLKKKDVSKGALGAIQAHVLTIGIDAVMKAQGFDKNDYSKEAFLLAAANPSANFEILLISHTEDNKRKVQSAIAAYIEVIEKDDNEILARESTKSKKTPSGNKQGEKKDKVKFDFNELKTPEYSKFSTACTLVALAVLAEARPQHLLNIATVYWEEFTSSIKGQRVKIEKGGTLDGAQNTLLRLFFDAKDVGYLNWDDLKDGASVEIEGINKILQFLESELFIKEEKSEATIYDSEIKRIYVMNPLLQYYLVCRDEEAGYIDKEFAYKEAEKFIEQATQKPE